MGVFCISNNELNLTGTHVGCEHGVCGACTILFDGQPVRSCLMFAVQADGHQIMTVEGLGTPEDLHPIQAAFWEAHGAQCGFCTPGFVVAAEALLRKSPNPAPEEVRAALAGDLCRCGAYVGVFAACASAGKGGRHA